jgi:hypothetical protein
MDLRAEIDKAIRDIPGGLTRTNTTDAAMSVAEPAIRKAWERAEQAEAKVASVQEALKSAGNALATAPDDWGHTRGMSWMWGLFCGWDCKENHEHDDCGDAMGEQAERHRWTPEVVARLRSLRSAVEALDQNDEGAGT